MTEVRLEVVQTADHEKSVLSRPIKPESGLLEALSFDGDQNSSRLGGVCPELVSSCHHDLGTGTMTNKQRGVLEKEGVLSEQLS